jgi:Major tropism determinant N-terminal domain
MTTAVQRQLRRGTSAQVAAFTGAQGELVADTTNNRLVLHDGATAGGFPAARRAEKQRSIATSADLPITADDVILNVKSTSPLTITLPAASSRGGNPVEIKIVIGSAAVTLAMTGSDTFDGNTSFMPEAGSRMRFFPYCDGVNNSLGYGL